MTSQHASNNIAGFSLRLFIFFMIAMFSGGWGAQAYNDCEMINEGETSDVRVQELNAPTMIDAYEEVFACGVERWSVKTGADADVNLVDLNSISPTTIALLCALPQPPSLPQNNRIQPTEIAVFQIYATLTIYKLESDSDYHLVLDDGLGNTMVTEIAAPSCVDAGSPFIAGIANARAQFDAVYTPTTYFKTANVPVRIRGVGFFDFLHGQTGMAPNGIEIHPILDILFNPSGEPPEVSGNTAIVPFTMSKSGGAIIFHFEYINIEGKYHIYGAPDEAFMDAGTWEIKICDLQNNPLGTYASDGSTWSMFTLNDGASLPENKYVVVYEINNEEGPYGYKSDGTPISKDSDRTTPQKIGCTSCMPILVNIMSVTPDPTVILGTEQTFNGAGTGEGALTYQWDFHYNGTNFNPEATGATVNYTYSATGTYAAALRVTDSCPNPGPQSFITTIAVTINPVIICTGPQVVISQVYGGGGNTGAYYKNDFIELFNRGTASQNLNGWSVQYASAAGSTWSVTILPNVSIPPGGYFLIQEAQGSGGTANLPTPDAIGTISMSATTGKVALVNSTAALTGICPTGSNILDFIGYGTNANCYEGTGAAPNMNNTSSNWRAGQGCIETNNNAYDFSIGTCDASNPPRNSAVPLDPCSCP